MIRSAPLQDLIQMLLGKEDLGGLGSRLAKGATGSFILKVGNTVLVFGIAVLLARLLGAASYGAYAYAMAWVNLLIIPAVVGLDRLLVRNVAVYRARSEWGLMHGLLRWSNWMALSASICLALLAIVVGPLTIGVKPEALLSFQVAMILLPLLALTLLRQATLQGIHHIVIGQLPEMLIQPVLFIALIGGAYFLWGRKLTASQAIGINIVATGVAFLVGVRLLQKHLPQTVKEALPVYQIRHWLNSAWPLLIVGGVRVINNRIDTIALGAIRGTELVGIYTASTRGAQLVTFVLMAVNAALAPTVAGLYARGEMRRLQRIVTRSAQVVLAVSLPIGLGLIVFGRWFLLLFGSEFTQGYTSLVILSLSQMINAGMGSVSVLLVMTGYERDVATSLGFSALLNIILDVTLIPQWGLNGAAMASASSMILWNLLLVVLVYKRLDIYSTALGRISLRWKT